MSDTFEGKESSTMNAESKSFVPSQVTAPALNPKATEWKPNPNAHEFKPTVPSSQVPHLVI